MFTEIKRDIEDSEKNKGVVRLADLRKKLDAENKKEKKAKGKKKDDSGALDAPVVDEGVNIVADMIGLGT